MTTPHPLDSRLIAALPFWSSLLLIPVFSACAWYGGWAVLLPALVTSLVVNGTDLITGLNQSNPDPNTNVARLRWYRLITLIWAPIQFVTLFGGIFYITHAAHLTGLQAAALAVGLGSITGTIGINYAHELMHQRNRLERWLADVLLAMVLYSHFRSEHLLVHHRYVGTPADAVTARYNETFYRFFLRVLPGSLRSAFRAEAALLGRREQPWYRLRNPFFRYWTLQTVAVVLAYGVGGWAGVGLFAAQALTAIFLLEVVNYVEHYGLTRRHLGEGRYEPVGPHHSWNAAHKASNWLLINLQRHSDHHYKPDRRFPLLQTYTTDEAPQLPYGYLVMTPVAMIPPLWLRRMNPRVRAWRRQFYPDITDWAPYNAASNPAPR